MIGVESLVDLGYRMAHGLEDNQIHTLHRNSKRCAK